MVLPFSRKTSFPIEREKLFADLVPYSSHATGTVICTNNNAYLSIIQFEGISYEGKSDVEIEKELAYRTQLYKLIDNPNLSLHYLMIKRAIPDPLHIDDDTFFNRLYVRCNTDNKQYFDIEHYIFILYHMPFKPASLWDFITGKSQQSADSDTGNQSIHHVSRATRRMMTSLNAHTPKLLGLYENDNVTYSEPLTLLYYLINHEHKAIPLTAAAINETLTTKRISLSSSGYGHINNHYFASKSIKETETVLRTGNFDDLLWLPCEWIMSLSFRYSAHTDIIKNIKRQIRLLHMTEDVGVTETDALELALDQIQSGDIIMGKSNFHILYFAKTEDNLADNNESITRVFDKAGILSTDDDIAIEHKYLSTLPGNWRYHVRSYTGLSSHNLAAIATYRKIPKGQLSHHWGNVPFATFKSNAATPYHLALHVHDLGNTLVVGQSGSGKTVLMSFLASRCCQLGSRVAYYDKDRGAELFIRAAGGHYHLIEPGNPTGFNPFSLENTPMNRALITSLVLSLLKITRDDIAPDQRKTFTDAISHVLNLPPQSRRLYMLQDLLPAGTDRALADALAPWIIRGQHAWLFDCHAETQSQFDQRIIGFDLTHILDLPELKGITLRYITSLVDRFLLTGDRACIVIDEGWRGLDDPGFADQIKNLFKVIRKKNGLVIFGSNNPADLTASPAGREIINQSPTKIFTPNQEGSPADYDGYELRPDQIKLILSMRKDSREFVLIQNEETTRLRFDLSHAPELIKLLSARENTVKQVEKLIQEHGPEPATWLPLFDKRLGYLYA